MKKHRLTARSLFSTNIKQIISHHRMTPSNTNKTLRIRLTTAKAINRVATMLFDLGVIEFSELQTVRAVMNSLARRGELPPEPEKRLVDIHEVAEKLAIGESTLKRLLADGSITLPKVKIGGAVRFRLADVESLMNNIESGSELPT